MELFHTQTLKYQLKDDVSGDKETEIKYYDYTVNSIAMICDENFGRSFAENLKTIGKYNAKLKIGKGWIFSKGKLGDLQKMIAEIGKFNIKGTVPINYYSKSSTPVDGPFAALLNEPSIIKDFKKLILGMSEINENGQYTLSDKNYLWGEIDYVVSTLEELGKTKSVVYEFKTSTHSIVMFN
jgi:hypothetical protein